MSLIQELKRRNVFRVALFYVVASWLVLQVAEFLFDILDLPEAWVRFILAALLIGFPVALISAWVFELTADGIKRESDVDRTSTIVSATGQRLNIATIVMVAVGIGLLALDRFVVPEASPTPVNAVQPVTENATVSTVAVLPFLATGSEDGGLLAGGLHDDLLTRLAKLGAFKVISRTSVMEYAETSKNMRQIGEELGARYILEGGVQALGNRVRINAQLIDAETDEHVWAHTFDHEMTAANLFDVQAELAKAIAGEMKATLSTSDNELIEQIPTQNIEAYSAYLRGLGLRERGGHNEANVALAISAFEQSVALDSEFTHAWAQLSIERSRRAQGTNDPVLEEAALAALDKARELQPGLHEVKLANVVYLYRVEFEYDSALQALQVLADQSSLGAPELMLRAFLLRRVGRIDMAYESALEAKKLDPRSVEVATHLIHLAWHLNHCEAAGTHARAAMALAAEIVDIVSAVSTYELMCNGNAQRANQLFDGVVFTGTSQIIAAREAATAARDFERVVELGGQSFAQQRFFFQITDELLVAEALRYLNQNELANAKIAAAGDAIAAIEEADGRSWEFAGAKMLYHSLTGDADQTAYWIAECKKRLRKQSKDDYIQQVYFLQIYAELFAAVGLHDEAIEDLQVMLETPGGARFPLVAIWPGFDRLRDHPGYIALRDRYSIGDLDIESY